MNTNQLSEIASSFEALAAQLRQAVVTKPPAYLRETIELLPDMPKSIEEIPAWLDQVTDEQFRASWVTVIIATFAEIGSDEHETEFKLSTRALLNILVGIRERYDAMMKREPIHMAPAIPMNKPESQSDSFVSERRVRREIDWAGLIVKAREIAPAPGDSFVLRQKFPEISSAPLAEKLRQTGDFIITKDHTSNLGPKAPLIATRKATASSTTSAA